MAEDTKDREKSLIPYVVDQNPAPVALRGQQAATQVRALTEAILGTFSRVLPSNYVSQISGPFYTTQFQAIAEVLARIQIEASEAALDPAIDFTRPEFLWQMCGSLVFPDVGPNGIPTIPGDISYRCFLKRMIDLLLRGARADVQKEGIELLTDAVVTVLEKVAFARDPNTAWGFAEQFEFEVNVADISIWTDPATGELIEGVVGTGFPDDPFRLQKNVAIVLRALKPAHTLYDYRHLFSEAFADLFVDEMSWDMTTYFYDDFRKFCDGAKNIVGQGDTLEDRGLFTDPNLDFRSVCPGAVLEILSGPNIPPSQGGVDEFNLGRYLVREVLRMPIGAESTPRAYTTSPTGLAGSGTIGDNGEVTDGAQDWSNVVEGEILTILGGSNAGEYRIDTLLGTNGGEPGFVSPGAGIVSIRVAPSLLRLNRVMPRTAADQDYRVGVDRLGCREPQNVSLEDASAQFYL